MTNNERLRQVFREIFGLDSVDDSMSRNDIPEWNSLQTINLIVALEDAFGVQFSPEEAVDMTGVGVIRNMLTRKGVDFSGGE